MYLNFEIHKRLQLRYSYRVGSQYFVHLQPAEYMSRDESLEVVRSFKNLKTGTEESLVQKLIRLFDVAIRRDNQSSLFSINNIECVISLPSQFPANEFMVELFEDAIGSDCSYLTDIFCKKDSQFIQCSKQLLQSEKSRKTEPHIIEYFKRFKESNNGLPFEIKHVNAKKRRYLYGFMELIQHAKHLSPYIHNKNILLVDDTIGEGVTFHEAIRLLSPFHPKSITCFAVLRDFRD